MDFLKRTSESEMLPKDGHSQTIGFSEMVSGESGTGAVFTDALLNPLSVMISSTAKSKLEKDGFRIG